MKIAENDPNRLAAQLADCAHTLPYPLDKRYYGLIEPVHLS